MDAQANETRIQLPVNLIAHDSLSELAQVVADLTAHPVAAVKLLFPPHCITNGETIGLLVRLALHFKDRGGSVTLIDPGPTLGRRLREMRVDTLFRMDGIS
jgi:hypothetical protein